MMFFWFRQDKETTTISAIRRSRGSYVYTLRFGLNSGLTLFLSLNIQKMCKTYPTSCFFKKSPGLFSVRLKAHTQYLYIYSGCFAFSLIMDWTFYQEAPMRTIRCITKNIIHKSKVKLFSILK